MTGRQCGACSLCCKLLPVRELDKGANERCKHQRHTGCRVYSKIGMPVSCKLWSCHWINGANVPRPDRSHYVIDVLPDFIKLDNEGVGGDVPVVQVWVDPDYPDAHRDPQLRAYLSEQAKQGYMALVRYDSKRAFALIAPEFASDGAWHEVHSNMGPEGQHTATQIAAVIKRRTGDQ